MPSASAPALAATPPRALLLQLPPLAPAPDGGGALVAPTPATVQGSSSSLKRRESSLTRLARKVTGRKHRDSEDSVSTLDLSLRQRQHEEEERRALMLHAEIERAAVDRDEKRKRRVGEALTSVHRRLDVASDSILAEMDETLERASLSRRDQVFYLAVVVVALMLSASLLPPMACAPLVAAVLVCKALVTGRQNRVKAAEAVDDVAARLQDLDDGVRRCELALELDIKAEAEWEREMEDERRGWEARQRELDAKRSGPRRATARVRTRLQDRSKQFVEKAKQDLERTVHQIETTVHRPIDAAKDAAKMILRRQGRSPSRPSLDESVTFEPGASEQWIKYVQATLPMERAPDLTADELEFEAELRQHCAANWDRLPFDIKLMVMRGYADKGNKRMELSVEGVNYIAEWREKTQSDELLKSIEPNALNFFKYWPTRFGGEDKLGHLVVYDRVEEIDVHALASVPEADFFRYRTQQLEVVRHEKKQIELRIGQRVCKHVYIMDLKGLTLQKHFSRQVKNLLQPIFKVAGDACAFFFS